MPQRRRIRQIRCGQGEREAADKHIAAQRNLFNRLIGCLHYCLATGQHYHEQIAFPIDEPTSEQAAA